jgi:hypothetical protein
MNIEQLKPPEEQEPSIEWLKTRNTELEKSNNLLIGEIAELRRLEMISKSQTNLAQGENNV